MIGFPCVDGGNGFSCMIDNLDRALSLSGDLVDAIKKIGKTKH